MRVAIKVLKVRFGSNQKLAKQLGVSWGSLSHMLESKRQPSAGVAIRVARVAGASVDAVLAGDWPTPGMCPMCGRTGE